MVYFNQKQGEGTPEIKEMKAMKDITLAAAALYDGGWRAEDKEELMSEYELTEEEATQLCEALADFE